MIGTLEVTIFAFLFLRIMDFFRRMTESPTRHSSANLNKIKPDVACSNQHALPRPVINDGFLTASGEDLNNQSFLRLKEKVDENNLIVLENERLANELSLVQSQLTDSHSKVKQFRIESATTKTKLEKQKRFITDITVKNIRLTNEDLRLRRKLESTNYFLESSRAESERLRTSLAEQQLDTRELAVATRELESKNTTISELETENLRLAENDSQLRRNIEDRDRIIASSAIEKNLIVLDKERLANELSLVQSQLTDSHSNLQLFQNVHDELATTKRELEKQKSLMTDMTEKNLRLANDDSRLRRKIEDRDRTITQIVMEKERLANELSQVQSQLADSSSKLQMFQNIHDELETTKCELEETNTLISAKTEEIHHLTNENSVLRRKVEAKDRVIAYTRANLEKLQNRLEEEKLHKVHDELALSQRVLVSKNRTITKLQEQNRESRVELEQLRTCLNEKQLDTQQLAVANRELESKNTIISELETENLRLAENDSQLRRKLEDADCLVLSSKMALEELQLSLNKQTERVNQLVDQMRTLDQEKDEAVRKLTELQQKQIQPKMTTDVGCGCNEVFHQIEEPIPAVTEITDIVTAFLASGLKPQADSSTTEPQPVNLSEILPSVFHHHQIEEPIRPSDEITDVVTAFLASGSTKSQAKSPVTVPQAHRPLPTDVLKNSPARNAVEKKAVKVSTKQPSAVLPEFYIKSTVEKQVDVDQIVVFGISKSDCGKVIGRNGCNAERIEEEYGVWISFVNGELFITGGDAERRLAACSDVCEKLTVTLECPYLNLRNNKYSNDYLLRKLSSDNYVCINPPSLENRYVTIWGPLANCRTVFEILKSGSR
ncbi:myosin heavy chain, striated muscle-like [Daphnia pulex]|uniref:myosin heavy chain, striated muscle-like n=1 Tax=Daphnia pulex TaxID=6669 RepID=UPI001EDEF05C|nr:myosin heavy chain, striated muscle-like [Daphnia pulex]